MTDGDHYASYADVQKALMDANIGVDGGTMYDDEALEYALDTSMDEIHMELDFRTTKVTAVPIANVLRKIQVETVFQMILMARHINQNNLVDAGSIQGFWQVTPSFTREQMRKLRKINSYLRGNNNVFLYSSHTGDQISF
jgi:hypothetical protein